MTTKSPAALASREVANHKEQGKPQSTERGPSEGRSARLERPQTPDRCGGRIEHFAEINRAALAAFAAMLARILSGGSSTGPLG